jgi:predicted transposase YdaD
MSGNPLMPILFFVRKSDLHLFNILWPTELHNESKSELALVALTTVVAAPHYKMVHSQKVDEKVKQMVSQFQ